MPCSARANVIHSFMAIAPTEKSETRKLAQEVGQRSVAQLEASLARIAGETGANNRWLLGALVLLNGGGLAVAASEAGLLAPQATEAAISFFVIGAALAVLAALGGALAALLLSRQIGEAIAHWAQVAAGGDVPDAALKAAGRIRQTGQISSLGTLALGLLSLILFVAGAMTLASGFSPARENVAEVPGNTAEATNAAAAVLPKLVPTATPAPALDATPTTTPASPPEAKPSKPEPQQAPRRPAKTPASTTAPTAAPSPTPSPASQPASAPAGGTPN